VEEAVVGPSLGKESITQGLISMAAGLGMVVIFMVLYYGAGGMVANAALLFNIFFIIGILAQFSAALTLLVLQVLY
jgi:SecD/SecF fusion protein